MGLSLCLADKLDVTYHKVINSSIHDEIMKIQSVDIQINERKLIITYRTLGDFDVKILKYWDKAFYVSKSIAEYLIESLYLLLMML